MKLDSYLMRNAFALADWERAIRILCRATDLAEEAVLALAIQPTVDDARGPAESISIMIGGNYAYWDSTEGFGLVYFQSGLLPPTIRIYRREVNQNRDD